MVSMKQGDEKSENWVRRVAGQDFGDRAGVSKWSTTDLSDKQQSSFGTRMNMFFVILAVVVNSDAHSFVKRRISQLWCLCGEGCIAVVPTPGACSSLNATKF